ncbi:hypothetical protein Q7P37_008298 [Cladosporium fusiforme]
MNRGLSLWHSTHDDEVALFVGREKMERTVEANLIRIYSIATHLGSYQPEHVAIYIDVIGHGSSDNSTSVCGCKRDDGSRSLHHSKGTTPVADVAAILFDQQNDENKPAVSPLLLRLRDYHVHPDGLECQPVQQRVPNANDALTPPVSEVPVKSEYGNQGIKREMNGFADASDLLVESKDSNPEVERHRHH